MIYDIDTVDDKAVTEGLKSRKHQSEIDWCGHMADQSTSEDELHDYLELRHQWSSRQ